MIWSDWDDGFKTDSNKWEDGFTTNGYKCRRRYSDCQRLNIAFI